MPDYYAGPPQQPPPPEDFDLVEAAKAHLQKEAEEMAGAEKCKTTIKTSLSVNGILTVSVEAESEDPHTAIRVSEFVTQRMSNFVGGFPNERY